MASKLESIPAGVLVLLGACFLPLAGCRKAPNPVVKSFVELKSPPPGVKRKRYSSSEDGFTHELVLATADSKHEVRIVVLVAIELVVGETRKASAAEVALKARQGYLTVEPDWHAAGGGERPCFRRESEAKVTVYYPIEAAGFRSWAKYIISIE